MDFNEWINAPTEDIFGNEGLVSIYQRVMDGDYDKRRDILTLLEEAYEVGKEAGWVQAGDYL
tara:strand:+ start:344 stop:529 length:186 start_codon:yes stop_codon:yes gene_type:complete